MGTGKILIVDDEADLRIMLAEVCRISGYCVNCADNGMDALRRLEEETYSLIIVDYQMPGMDGIELVRKVRERGNLLPVIAMSAMDAGKLFIDAGANLFMKKPFNYKLLGREIAMILGSSNSET
ncbi:MAG: response regulator [Thermodesulfovibrionales bacterium]